MHAIARKIMALLPGREMQKQGRATNSMSHGSFGTSTATMRPRRQLPLFGKYCSVENQPGSLDFPL